MKRFISALSSLCLAATSLCGSVSAIPASAAEVKADSDIVYDLIPSGKKYTAASSDTGYNSYTAKPGEELTVDWTVKNDQGTAGLQMTLDFSQVEYVDAEKGDAYKGKPIFNDDTGTDGEIVYTFGQATEMTAADEAVIYSFDIKVPSKNGSYKMGVNKSANNKVVPKDQTKPYSYVFHGLEVTVEGGDDDKKDDKKDDTPAPEGTIVYNLIPSGKKYDAVADGAKTNTNNTYYAAAGEEIVVDWVVKNDGGTAGLQMTFDFSKVDYQDADKGDAYKGKPIFNDDTGKDGEIVYTFGQATEMKAADGAVIYSFNIKAPTKDGKYPITLDTSANNKVVPKDQSKPYSYLVHGLDIIVGDKPQDDEKEQSDAIQYNFVPDGIDYTAASGKGDNKVTVKPGTKMTVNWTVKNDPGTAGMQMTFDFSDVNYQDAERGDAYKGKPQFNDNTGKDGEIIYTFGQATEMTAADNAVIYSFEIKAPSKEGTYTIGLDSSADNKVIPKDQEKKLKYEFHGLEITVSDKPVETEAPEKETTAPNKETDDKKETDEKTTTTEPKQDQEKDQPKNDDIPAGSAQWTIGEVVAAAGAEVKVPVTVSGDEGSAGFRAAFTFDSKLKLKDIEWGDAYNNGKAKLNSDDSIAVWADANGKDQKAADKAVVLNLVFTAPAESGEYKVDFSSLEVTNTSGNELKLTKKSGLVKVTGNAVNWIIGEETVAPGATAKIPVTVKGDKGTGGFRVEFAADSNLKFSGFSWGDGYTGTATLNKDELIAVWASKDGANQKAADDAVVLYLNFTAPNKEGKYPVEFKTIEVVDTDGIEAGVATQNGNVIVKNAMAGSAQWIIADKTCAANAVVKVPVSVRNDTGTAGFTAEFEYDPALKFTEIEWADGYTGKAKINNDEKLVVWADAKGEDQKAVSGAVVMNLVFTAPAKAGTYPVTFKDLDVYNTDGNGLALTRQDGSVTVLPEEAGSADWIIGKETVAAGAEVKLPVTVKNDSGTAGFVAAFSYDSKLKFNGISEGDAYAGKMTVNGEEVIAVWGSNKNTKAADGATVLYLNFTAPNEAGTYEVRFSSLDVCDEEGAFLKLTEEDGWVKVLPPDETTSTTIADGTKDDKTTSTTANPQDGTDVSKQDTTDNAVTDATNVETDASGNPVTSTTVATNAPVETDESGNPIKGTTTVTNAVETDESGNPIKGTTTVANGSTQPGTSDDKQNQTTAQNPGTTKGNDESKDNPKQDEILMYEIDNVIAVPNSTVKVPVYVKNDEGTAGFEMSFKVPEGFKITGIEKGNAYTGNHNEYKWNQDESVLVWASQDGKNQAASNGAVIVNLLVQVPADAKIGTKYPVEFVKDSVFATDTERKELTVVTVDGSILILDKLPDDTSTTTTKQGSDGTDKEQSGTGVSGTDASVSNIGTTTTVAVITTVVTEGKDGTSTGDGQTTSGDGKSTTTAANGSTDANASTTSAQGTTDGKTTTTAADGTTANGTTETAPEGSKIMTNYTYTYEKPTRVNYWSHDPRSFKESGGLKGLAVELTVNKYYVAADATAIPADAKPYATKKLDVTAYSHPDASEDGPKKVWENEIKAQFGENYAVEKELEATHANKYPIKVYYNPAEQSDPDFNINGGKPVELGTFDVYIGVKGDVNLDNHVDVTDAQLTLIYYTEKTVTMNENAVLNEDADLNPLCLYLADVAYAPGEGEEATPIGDEKGVNVVDAQMILIYYTEKYVTLNADTNWESVVGYDMLDSFFGGVEEGK